MPAADDLDLVDLDSDPNIGMQLSVDSFDLPVDMCPLAEFDLALSSSEELARIELRSDMQLQLQVRCNVVDISGIPRKACTYLHVRTAIYVFKHTLITFHVKATSIGVSARERLFVYHNLC